MTSRPSRGFVTLAVGDEAYYRMALNLLKSYRRFCKDPLPFAIFADRHNEYTRQFDHTLIIDNPTRSYLDKLSLLGNPPFEKNIFIDADCLAYKDLNYLFGIAPAAGVACPGRRHPLDNTSDGWFAKEDVGEYRDKIKFIPQLHSGIIFFANDSLTAKIHTEAMKISGEYHKYRFRIFDKPADEPVLALAIASCGGSLVDVEEPSRWTDIVFYSSAKKVYSDISRGLLSYINADGEKIDKVSICHWGNYNTNRFQYQREVSRLDGNTGLSVSLRPIAAEIAFQAKRVSRKIFLWK